MEVDGLDRLKYAGRVFIPASLILCVIIVFTSICPSHVLFSRQESRGVSPADSGEKFYRIVLPVVLPDNQAAAGTVFIQEKSSIQPTHSKWIAILLFVCILLYGCTVPLITCLNRPIRTLLEYKSEISLRMGGHAPPACIRVYK
jgi:hypothetical protein